MAVGTTSLYDLTSYEVIQESKVGGLVERLIPKRDSTILEVRGDKSKRKVEFPRLLSDDEKKVLVHGKDIEYFAVNGFYYSESGKHHVIRVSDGGYEREIEAWVPHTPEK